MLVHHRMMPSRGNPRLARLETCLHAWSRAEALLHLNTMPPGFVLGLLDPLSLTGRAFATRAARELGDHNRNEPGTVEMPTANGIGTARSVAKLYGCVATGGAEIGMTPDTFGSLVNAAVPPSKGRRDKVLHVDTERLEKTRIGPPPVKAGGGPNPLEARS
jgi:hypothetical protein